GATAYSPYPPNPQQLKFDHMTWLRKRISAAIQQFRRNRARASELIITFDEQQTIRLPVSLSEPVWLRGDPEFGIFLSMPIVEADLLMSELKLICDGHRDKSVVELERKSVLLKGANDRIVMRHNSWFPIFGKNFAIESVRTVIEQYNDRRQNYSADGKYQFKSK
ncbi:MAG: hypothetical protein ABL893_18580, partial [Hyphomicrobium sp.]